MKVSFTCLIAAVDCSRFEVSSIDDEYDCDDGDGDDDDGGEGNVVASSLSIECGRRRGAELLEATSIRRRLLPTELYIYYCYIYSSSGDRITLYLAWRRRDIDSLSF